MPMQLVIAGGGTGGHFFPALEVLKKAKEREIGTLFVGAQRGIEKSFEDIIPGRKLFLELYPFRGVSLLARLKALWSFWKGISALGGYIEGDFRSLIFGGYASVPVGVHTNLKKKALFIHEQNSVPGMTNKLLSGFAGKVFITFEHSKRFFPQDKVIKAGLPIREELLNTKLERKNAKEALGIEPKSPLFLFMGGSQGARFLNNLAVDFAKKTGAQTFLLSGEKDFERISELAKGVDNLKLFPFRTDMGLVYSATDVAVCRSGAGTVSELSLFGVPAVFIPYPYATGDHQYYNAKEIEELGGAFVIRQEDTNTDKLVALVDRIMGNIASMRKAINSFCNPEAHKLILDEVLKE